MELPRINDTMILESEEGVKYEFFVRAINHDAAEFYGFIRPLTPLFGESDWRAGCLTMDENGNIQEIIAVDTPGEIKK